MVISEIPLQPGAQAFDYTFGTIPYRLTLQWRGTAWVLDIDAQDQTPIVHGLPVLPGADLLAQHRHLGIPAQLLVLTDDGQAPTYEGLGTVTHLYAATAS